MKSLESDFFRYVSRERENMGKHKIWIVDTILSDYHKKRVSGESLIPSKYINEI